ncbi:MAG TPA: N-acetylglucosaminyltransferase [Desulfovibrio piger]|nr:glycosyltransferase [Nitratidesulfovibrio liaohensis]NHZ45548.1 glycosyltransferase family 2 protein [Nitratidesulfovibrio liaohensis]HCZ44766.1 N-acetylglucosaminyltransferase [Desulfovibrio piger]
MDVQTLCAFVRMLMHDPFSYDLWSAISFFIPFVLFLELPVYLLVFVGLLAYWVEEGEQIPAPYLPRITCIVTCYAEGDSVRQTIRCLAEQVYDGEIEIIAVVDGATINHSTLRAARSMIKEVQGLPRRHLFVLPKWQRGGRVSGLNAGLALARGEIIMAMDADTSFDNDIAAKSVRHFVDPFVVGVAGALRVRNASASPVARLQALEYLLSIHAGKTGLSTFNVVNNISGAFGIFRAGMLRHIGGWDSGTAEDLDATLRLKAYMGRHPKMRIIFAPDVVGHTDVPETLKGFFAQRMRWDGDLAYLYLRKHNLSFSHRVFGWRNWIMQAWTGVMFQVFTPLLIVGYMTLLAFTMSPQQLLTIFGAVYLFYLAVTCSLYATFVCLISERRVADLQLAPWIVLFPLFTFTSRCISACAILWELIGKGHLDSSMAPWWVLKKTRY